MPYNALPELEPASRHILPMRMHDQEKLCSPPLRVHGGYSYNHEEREYTDEERKRAFQNNPFLVDMFAPVEQESEPVPEEPPKQPYRGGIRDGGTIRHQNYDAKGRRK